MNQYSIMDDISKSKTTEGFTQLSNEAIQDIQTVANIYKSGTMTLSNLHVTGNLTVDGTNGGIVISPNGNISKVSTLQAGNTNINGTLDVTGTTSTNSINNNGLINTDNIQFPKGWIGMKGTIQGLEFYDTTKTNCTMGLFGGFSSPGVKSNGVYALGGAANLPGGFCSG